MKYNENNKPLQCMMTQSTCYQGTYRFTPRGILWHSTGANNPWIKRYVQPDDNAPNRQELLNIIGRNEYGNDWNHVYVEAGLNCWIGKLQDGTVSTVQTMPWDYRPWGCGSGWRGSLNNTHIQFEVCEDGLYDKDYAEKCYWEACEITAYLCKMYGIDPLGSFVYNGVTVPNITDHVGSYYLGMGSQHGDVQHWFPRIIGKNMDSVRADVGYILNQDKPQPTPTPTPEPTPEPDPTPTPPPKNHPDKPNPEPIPVEDWKNAPLTYRTYVQWFGWLPWVKPGTTSGTQGQKLRIECLQIDGKGLDLQYRVHQQKVGDSEWVKNGEKAGVQGKELRIEAFEIKCNKKIKYRAYVQGKGWLPWVSNEQWAGTRGESLRMEAIQIKLA